MKKFIKVNLLAIAVLLLAGCACCKKAKAETISFYDVPLVCGAAPEIGCGSRAKPVLLEMEKNPSIKEAWLNRAGTVYAIVWADADKTDETAKPIFEKYKVEFKKLNSKEAEKLSPTFRETGKWYRGAEVDKLSIEEAGVIAKDAVTFALNDKLLSEQEANTIRVEIENYLKTELVKVRTVDELYGNEGTKKFRNDLSDIIAKTIGKERADKITELYMQKKSFEKKEKKACCEKKTEKDACCKKK
jgi:flagellar basal body-associated protein FliL